MGQRRPARAEPRAADRGARVAARRARLDGPAATRRSGSSSSRRSRRGWRATCGPRRRGARASGEALQRELCGESLGVLPGARGRGDRRRLRRAGLPHRAHVGRRGRARGGRGGVGDRPRARRAGADRRRGAGAGAGADRAAVRAAVLFPDEARCDPVRLAAAVGAAAVGRGVRLRTGVEAYAVGAGRRARRRTGRSAPGPVVVAAGAWSGRLAPDRRRPAAAAGRQGLRGGVGPGGRAAADAALPARPARASPTRWATARG